jgi:hypothetical protein
MPQSDAELFAIARRAFQAFGHLPYVHAVGVGGRERNGQPTGEIVLKVLVTDKVPLESLPPDARVPAQFEGVPTDVVTCGIPSPGVVTGVPPMTPEQLANFDTRRLRPLRGGICLQGALRIGQGTLGCVMEVVENSNLVFAATCSHVLFNSFSPQVADMKVGQPTADESCTGCCNDVFGKFFWGIYAHDSIDVALVRLDPGAEWQATIDEVGLVTGQHDVSVAEAATLTYSIRKRGVTTRLTGGQVQAVGLTGTTGPGRRYTNGVGVRPNPDPANPGGFLVMSHAGDSGAAYVNDAGEVVAIHFLGDHSPTSAQNGWGFGFPVGEVIAQYNSANGQTLRVARAGNPNTVNVVPGASPVGPTAGAVVQRDFNRTVRGRALVQLWLRHSSEVNAIVQHQRRAATVWHRQHGPELLRLLAGIPFEPTLPIPEELGGRPVGEGLAAFLDQIERFGSAELRRCIADERAFLMGLPGRSYSDLLRTFSDDEDDSASPSRGVSH